MDIKAKYIISQMYGGVKVIKVNKWEIENGRRARNGLAKNTGSQKKRIWLDMQGHGVRIHPEIDI